LCASETAADAAQIAPNAFISRASGRGLLRSRRRQADRIGLSDAAAARVAKLREQAGNEASNERATAVG